MAIITISRSRYSHGKEIAEEVARRLNYECVSREVLREASQFFNIPENELLKAIHDPPNIVERLTHGKETPIAYIRAALLEHAKKDNIVYHGHAGHLLLSEIHNVLKVRVNADTDDRLSLVQQREKISKSSALARIKSEDSHRMRWTRYLYHLETKDPMLYDIVIHIGVLSIKDACDIICCAANSGTYKLTKKSLAVINELAICSHVKAAVQKICAVDVTAKQGIVHIKIPAQKIVKSSFSSPKLQERVQDKIKDDLTRDIRKIVKKIPGVKDVICDIKAPYYS